MILLDTLRMALAAFGSNKLRTGLTMLGIIIGVGAVIALMARAGRAGGRHQQVAGLGSNLLHRAAGHVRRGGGGVRNGRSRR